MLWKARGLAVYMSSRWMGDMLKSLHAIYLLSISAKTERIRSHSIENTSLAEHITHNQSSIMPWTCPHCSESGISDSSDTCTDCGKYPKSRTIRISNVVQSTPNARPAPLLFANIKGNKAISQDMSYIWYKPPTKTQSANRA